MTFNNINRVINGFSLLLMNDKCPFVEIKGDSPKIEMNLSDCWCC